MTDIQAWLDEARTLADKTIPGPWRAEWVEDDDWHEIHGQPFDGMVCPQVATIQGGGENDAAFIADARTRLPQALHALQAVLDLHAPEEYDGYPQHRPDGVMCAVCMNEFDEYVEWPCRTVQAIQTAIEEQPC